MCSSQTHQYSGNHHAIVIHRTLKIDSCTPVKGLVAKAPIFVLEKQMSIIRGDLWTTWPAKIEFRGFAVIQGELARTTPGQTPTNIHE
jgi:hypothetical protein